MHPLFGQVLEQRNLSKAGDLFSLSDVDIEPDVSLVLHKIRDIINVPGYSQNNNDQSVVEICVNRVTSAIRETGTVEKHIWALVLLLESCLAHNLRPTPGQEDPPHAKVASDLLGAIFLNYSKPTVMELALPVAVRFLRHGNKDLSRNMSSYLSLTAMENSALLGKQIYPILDSVIMHKNYSLVRVLVQMYSDNKDAIHDSVPKLVALLPECDKAEKTIFLQLFGLVAKERPRILESCVVKLFDEITTAITAPLVLQIFIDMATGNPDQFTAHMPKLKSVSEIHPSTVCSVGNLMACIGKIDKTQAQHTVEWFVVALTRADASSLPPLLRQLLEVCESFPSLLPPHIGEVGQYAQGGSVSTLIVIEQLRELARKSGSLPEKKTVGSQTEGVVTIVKNDQPHMATKVSHVALSAPSTGTIIPDSKNASTSTREINYPQSLTSAPAPTGSTHGSCSILGSVPQVSVPATIGGSVTAMNANVQMPMQSTPLSPMSRQTSGSQSYVQQALAAIQLSLAENSITPQPPPHSCTLTPHSSTPYLPPPPITIAPGSHSTTLTGGATIPRSTLAKNRMVTDERRSLPTPISHYVGQPQAIHLRDPVHQFCEKHLQKIKVFIENVSVRLPIPIKATLEESKHKRRIKLHFICFGQGHHCLYHQTFFTIRTKNPKTWIHLMFLAIQARCEEAVTQQKPAVGNLKACWDSLRTDLGNGFVRLVTSNFPAPKEQELLMHELNNVRYFDVFEFNAPKRYWACFLCNHPEKATGLLQDGLPTIEGQLKEKKGKWKIFKRWKTRYFTLSGATITYNKTDTKQETLPVSHIQTVKAVRRGVRDIPKAFEIFTRDERYVFKAKDGKNAEQWLQCLHIAVAQTQTCDRVTDSDIHNWSEAPTLVTLVPPPNGRNYQRGSGISASQKVISSRLSQGGSGMVAGKDKIVSPVVGGDFPPEEESAEFARGTRQGTLTKAAAKLLGLEVSRPPGTTMMTTLTSTDTKTAVVTGNTQPSIIVSHGNVSASTQNTTTNSSGFQTITSHANGITKNDDIHVSVAQSSMGNIPDNTVTTNSMAPGLGITGRPHISKKGRVRLRDSQTKL